MESIFNLYRVYTENQESPDDFHIWTCIAIIISTLGKNVHINFRYKIFPNEYIILIAGSARCRKSAALQQGTDLLFDLDDPPPVSSQKITHESLIEFLGTHGGVGTVSSSELAVFLGADCFGTGLLGTLCDLYDFSKRPWSYHTKSRGIEVVGSPLLNIFGASTPDWLGRLLSVASTAGGFTSRVLFVWGDDRRFKVARPVLTPRIEEARASLISRLNDVRKLEGVFAFTPEGGEYYDDWYETTVEGDDTVGMDGYYGRKQTHVLKIAMAIAAAESLELSLDAPHIETAVRLLDHIERSMPKIYSEIIATPEGKSTQRLLSHITKHGKVSHRNLHRAVWRYMSSDQLKGAMDTLISSGKVQCDLEGPRKTRVYTLLRDAEGEWS